MQYEGNIFRPPSEAYSLIVQATIGCAHNECTFCSMFKDKQFRIRKVSEVIADLEEARGYYSNVGRIFLADGDALVLKQEELLEILLKIQTLFPECARVGIYGSPQDVLRKGVSDLAALKTAGLGIVYIGAESGSDRILKQIKKGATAAEITEAIKTIEASGVDASATFISGLAGADEADWREHAEATGRMISAAQPSYVGLLTLMVEPLAPIHEEIRAGRFKLLSPEGVVAETLLLLENTNVTKDCVFRSNHASNYLSLKGTLPGDKARMIRQLTDALGGKYGLKDERLRML
ncbi:MAG: B12-binding domain-containing radical SAM protein [Clostridiales Family XIII bacterium]|jgi:radical SAM superfamily enzyme YgiQ (UPF0313 family)|nr:B12-binding domain-containing radical SAM protein [Clostridiales Family XIII bacterium]